MGSTRATAYRWRLDVQALTAQIVEEKRRQLYAMDERLNVKPIAESLAEAIIAGRADERLKIGKDESVRLNIGPIIPQTVKETTSARRKRLRRHLDALLEPHGWRPVRANVYAAVSRHSLPAQR
jgi:hypothetical protein